MIPPIHRELFESLARCPELERPSPSPTPILDDLECAEDFMKAMGVDLALSDDLSPYDPESGPSAVASAPAAKPRLTVFCQGEED